MLLFYMWVLIQLLIGYNLILPVLSLVLYKINQFSKQVEVSISQNTEADYGIIVTAYEQTENIPALINSILALEYKKFHVYVVADNCDISGLSFNKDRVLILRPEKVLANNVLSHFYAIDNFIREHSHLTIIDSDNLVNKEYLSELNHYFNFGFRAVQGVRKAKNLDTTYACLDAARDLYYHFYDGRVLFGCGSSATLSGSAMAFETDLYKECLSNLEIKGAGFDKVLQYEIVKRDIRIAYAQKAIVYDEKTSATDQLVSQRARWINTWLKYCKYGFTLIRKGADRFNLNQILFGIVLLRPPLFIFLTLSILSVILNLWISVPLAVVMSFGLACFISAFLISVIRKDTDRRIYFSLLNIPRFIFYQFLSLTKIRRTNKMPVSTKHFNPINIEDIS
jgi:cellulose synthase/poly-beta-1,6-N-acetylglucosamine synthase-like glycosyltransferase